jgi:hypothetical protein
MSDFHLSHPTSVLRMAVPVLLLTMMLGSVACSSTNEGTPAGSGPTLPEGWSVRADSGTGKDNQLMIADGTYHFLMGGPPSNNGTFYNPTWTATGDHTFSATFTQNAAATHPTSYGLMFGGSNLDGADQTYSYFLVRQAGEYYIANRNASKVTAVVPWTADKAIAPEGKDGKQTNSLSLQVTGDQVAFSINGAELKRLPASGLHVNGLYGFRIGHRLDITVTNVMK